MGDQALDQVKAVAVESWRSTLKKDNGTTLAEVSNKTDKDTARSRAVMTYCAMVGTISMARAVSDKELSREALKTVAQRLKNPAS
jgi:cob(I)alamin adenosyltransferase